MRCSLAAFATAFAVIAAFVVWAIVCVVLAMFALATAFEHGLFAAVPWAVGAVASFAAGIAFIVTRDDVR